MGEGTLAFVLLLNSGLRGQLIANAALQIDQGQVAACGAGVNFIYCAQPITPKSALGAGFDGRDQSWPLHPQPPEWGSWLSCTDQGDICVSVLPFFFLKPPA